LSPGLWIANVNDGEVFSGFHPAAQLFDCDP